MKRRLYLILNKSSKRGDLSWWFDGFLISLISLNALAIILESVEPIRNQYEVVFNRFEIFSVIFFTLEYILRVWTANEDRKFRKPIIGNLRYCLTSLAIIDLLAILPFYLPLFIADFRSLKILRLFRLFRIFKIVRYVKALTLINRVIYEKREELFISIIFTFFLLIISSTVMYHVENEAQPEKFSSIPQTMWWGIETLTTVGYGDVYPVTTIGRLIGGIIAVLGIGLFALPAGILSSGFSAHLGRKKTLKFNCPRCGHKIEKKTE